MDIAQVRRALQSPAVSLSRTPQTSLSSVPMTAKNGVGGAR